MSYRVPVIGETWRAKTLPDFIDVTVCIDDLGEDESGDAVVEFTATTTVGKASNVRPRKVKLNQFVQNYELATADSSGGAS